MGREAMIRADMESVGIYSPIFDSTIKQLAKRILFIEWSPFHRVFVMSI